MWTTTRGGLRRRQALHGRFEDMLGPAATQADVYRKVEDVVLQTTEGINACVMAYGQTGAGKTHTMLGENDGIIPKALNALFDKLGSDEPPTPVPKLQLLERRKSPSACCKSWARSSRIYSHPTPNCP